jgi:D-glycero-D-manno-heptose 1,7-bisphosphate phosphatase
MASPAVFLDRDGTMINNAGYLRRLADLHWYPWAIGAVRLLNRAGFLVCVTTNQGGVGLGLMDDAFVFAAHQQMARDLEAGGARVDGWFVCPHHPRSPVAAFSIECECRKPKPGLIRQAQERFDIDMSRSFVVGDTARDMGMADAAGLKGVLVRTGDGENDLLRYGAAMPGVTHIADQLASATAWILRKGNE